MSMNVTEILAGDGSSIYIQYDDEDEISRDLQAVGAIDNVVERTSKFKETLGITVSNYSEMIFGTVTEGMKHIRPDKLTLELGIQIGGEAGIPIITKGTAQANVKVTVEWNLKR